MGEYRCQMKLNWLRFREETSQTSGPAGLCGCVRLQKRRHYGSLSILLAPSAFHSAWRPEEASKTRLVIPYGKPAMLLLMARDRGQGKRKRGLQ
jgi:hypothetical protein